MLNMDVRKREIIEGMENKIGSKGGIAKGRVSTQKRTSP